MKRNNAIPRLIAGFGIPLLLSVLWASGLAQDRQPPRAGRNPDQEQGIRPRDLPDARGDMRQMRRGEALDNADRARMAQDLMRRVFDRLDLSDQQKLQIRQIHFDSQADIRAARAQVRNARRTLEESLYGDNFDQTVVEARIKDVTQAEANLLHLETESQAKVRQVLTPEQVRRFRELRDFVRSLGNPEPNQQPGPPAARKPPNMEP